MREVEAHIREWIEEISTIRPELRNFSVCPYASAAKYTIIECHIEDIIPVRGYDVVFYVVEDYLDRATIQYWVKFYNDLFDEYIFLEDCASYNLISMQNKEE